MQCDKRVFGVISGMDSEGEFKIGNIKFKNNDILPRIIIQSSGEGGIWVSNINGNLNNGDLITTSPISGLGMRQNSGYVTNYSIAKITCECNFKSKKCIVIKYKNMKFKKMFVGCVYLS